MDIQSRRDWAGFAPDAIPTKAQIPQLERWLDRSVEARGICVLDVGCGAGAITRRLSERGLDAVGIDINAAAIERLQRELPHARFYERDIAAPAGFQLLDEPPFELVVCQLVISIIGDARDRTKRSTRATSSRSRVCWCAADKIPCRGHEFARDQRASPHWLQRHAADQTGQPRRFCRPPADLMLVEVLAVQPQRDKPAEPALVTESSQTQSGTGAFSASATKPFCSGSSRKPASLTRLAASLTFAT
jgi:SAM-dependent methyltransferase